MGHVQCQPAPELEERLRTAVACRDAGPPELHGAAEHVGRKLLQLELLLRVPAVVEIGHLRRLQPVRSDESVRAAVEDHQVMTDGVELVLVPPGIERLVETLAELQVEHLEAEPQDAVEVVGVAGEPDPVRALVDDPRGQPVGAGGIVDARHGSFAHPGSLILRPLVGSEVDLSALA